MKIMSIRDIDHKVTKFNVSFLIAKQKNIKIHRSY